MLGTDCLPASKVANPICAKSVAVAVAVAVAKTICSDVQTLKRLLPPPISSTVSLQDKHTSDTHERTVGQTERERERQMTLPVAGPKVLTNLANRHGRRGVCAMHK